MYCPIMIIESSKPQGFYIQPFSKVHQMTENDHSIYQSTATGVNAELKAPMVLHDASVCGGTDASVCVQGTKKCTIIELTNNAEKTQ